MTAKKSDQPNSPTGNSKFTRIQRDELANMFGSQNFRLKDIKDGNPKTKALTKEQLQSFLSLDSEKELDELFEECLNFSISKSAIAQHIADCCIHDEIEFEDAIKNFWFEYDQFRRIKLRVNKLRANQIAASLDRKAAAQFSEKLKINIHETEEGHVAEYDQNFWARDEKDGKPKDTGTYKVRAIIPQRYLNIASLLDSGPYSSEKGDEEYRTSVAYRLRTDCNEILRMAATACDMSATEFVETLILEASHVFVRGAIGANSYSLQAETEEDKKAHHSVEAMLGKVVYDGLKHRFENENCGAYFPAKGTDKGPKNRKIVNYKRWFPDDDQKPDLKFGFQMTVDDAMKEIYRNINRLKSSNTKNDVRLHVLIDLIKDLAEIEDTKADDDPRTHEEIVAQKMNDWWDSRMASPTAASYENESEG